MQYVQELRDRQNRVDQAESRWVRRRTITGTGLLFAVIFVALGVVSELFRTDMGLTYQAALLLTIGFGVCAALTLGAAFFMPGYLDVRRRERQRDKELRDEVKQAAVDIRDATDFTELVKANTKNLSSYTELARTQAATSFRNSQIAMGVGLIVLFGGSVATLAASGTITKVAAGSLTALGGAFAGYIARTFLRGYNSAIEQVNFAFRQPLVNSYLLAAERLADKMSTPEAKDNALVAVIDQLVLIILRVVPDPDGTTMRRTTPAPRRSGQATPG